VRLVSSNLQNFIVTLLEYRDKISFFDLTVRGRFNEGSLLASENLNFGSSLAKTFLLADLSLYAGVVVIILILGSSYRHVSGVVLTKKLLQASAVSIYVSALLNMVGLFAGSGYIASFNLYLFENSYVINFFTQSTKLILVAILGSLYVLFFSVYKSRIRCEELPLLIQIAAALCTTVISSSNFALLLLSLEGFSLILYVMTALSRTYGGVTASVKYFTFGTLGSIFLF
jgi:NADH:ubiquinone oxidoreductase subunit 2 (subunit N)